VRAIPGTGLGLTITKLLTQIMGGEILPRSTPGQGTTFTVRLLLSEAMHGTHEEHIPGRVRGHDGPQLGILLIDDDRQHLDMLRNLLQPLRFNLLAASDGHTGLQLAAQHRPQLAMVDISLPDMTGWQIAAQLKQTHPQMRIAMVSANAHEYHSGGEGSSHDAFIMKPVDMQAVLDCIGRLLGLTWSYDVPPRAANDSPQPGSDLPVGSRHHLDDLYQLGRIGHVRGIQAKLRAMEEEDAANRPFATRLRGLVANFDLKRYMNVVEAMRNG
jgi:CheY-like chemotaxis protein